MRGGDCLQSGSKSGVALGFDETVNWVHDVWIDTWTTVMTNLHPNRRRIVLKPRHADNSESFAGPRSSDSLVEESPKTALPISLASGFEWKTRANLFGIPLICVSCGRDHQGKTRVAKGFLAIGQFAFGGIVIAQFGAGILAIGQFVAGVLSCGQLALGLLMAVGQISFGTFAIGQIVVGLYGLGQIGWGKYLWCWWRIDMEAVSMFHTIKMMLFHEGGITPGEVAEGGFRWGSDWLLSLFK